MDTDSLVKYENMWGVHPDNPHNFDNNMMIELITNNFGLENVNNNTTNLIKELIEIANNIENPSIDDKVRINRVLELTYYARHVSTSLQRMQQIMKLHNDYRNNDLDTSLFRFKAIAMEDNSKYQNFILYSLEYMHSHGYRRYNECVYSPIFTDDGYNTHAWRKIGSITDILYESIVKETNYDQFINATNQGNYIKQAAEFIANCKDLQFPELKKDRHIFSFRNGIYFAKDKKFMNFNEVPSTIVSSKYFNKDFPVEDAKCPHFESILDYQDLSEEVKHWVKVFIGRMIYEIDEMDGWQVIMFLQGQAGTGKSTIALNVCKQLYDEEDVGTLSNNFQQTFGLSDLVDRKIWIAPEIKRDFNMKQCEFQSIVSGDVVTVNIKYKQSRFETWTIPGMLAGNEPPDYTDNSGSFQRRMIPIMFVNKVKNGDLLLGRKIQAEMPHIIKICNEAYLEEAEKCGREDVWSHLPEYFTKARAELAASTNSLIHFLSSGTMNFSPELYISEKVFQQVFNHHCSESGYKRQRFNKDFYLGPFSQYGIKVLRGVKKKYPPTSSRTSDGPFFMGMDLANEDEIEDDPDDL